MQPDRTPSAAPAYRLTSAQRRNLVEMLKPDGDTKFWNPYGAAEFACARALKAKGLLEGSAVSWSDAYCLSDEGLRVARQLKEAEPNV